MIISLIYLERGHLDLNKNNAGYGAPLNEDKMTLGATQIGVPAEILMML